MKTLLHLSRFLIGIDQPHTQVTHRELALLQSYAQDAEIIVEIGCYEGRTSAALAGSSRKLKRLYSIDPFLKGRLGICYGHLIARIHCYREGATNVELIKGFSHEVAPRFEEKVDFLFIDADHSYAALKRDWQDWSGKVRRGGIIALHDCKRAVNSPVYLGSMQFYESDIPNMPDLEEVATVDSLVVFKVR